MKPVIYIDVLFLVNFFINSALLLISAKILKRPYKPLRLFGGASVGAIYAVCMFFPKMQFMYTLLSKFIMSLLIVSVSFKIVKFSLYLKTVCIFYLASFTFGGTLMAVLHLTSANKMAGAVLNNGIFYFNLPFGTVIITSLIAYVLISILFGIYRQGKNVVYKEVSVYLDGKHTSFRALIDTGNMLIDPISNTPVMVAELKKLKTVLPNEFYDLITYNEDIYAVSSIKTPTGFESRIRLIPYSSLGEQNGILMGFKPDRVTIADKSITNIIIAMYNQNLSSTHEYDALLNPEILSQ